MIHLDRLQEYLPNNFVSQSNLSNIQEFLQVLPSPCLQNILFESYVSVNDPSVDVSCSIFSEYETREYFHETRPMIYFPEVFMKQSAWQRIQQFYTSWAKSNGVLYDKILNIWFEFDTSSFSSMVLIPNVFFRSIPTCFKAKQEENSYSWITETALPMLLDFSISDRQRQHLYNCMQFLPLNTRVTFYVGVMYPRQTQSIRFVTRGLKIKQVLPYLESIQYSEIAEKIQSLVEDLSPVVDFINPSFDVGTDIESRLGLECWINDYSKERWIDVVEYLSEKKLCLLDKKMALIAYLKKNITTDTICSKISHVKIIYQSCHPVEAKVYLQIC